MRVHPRVPVPVRDRAHDPELASYGIDTHSIVVNQLLFPEPGSDCEQCNARRRMQKKYLDQIEELYDEFNVVKMPLLVEEVRGKEKLEKFSEMLVKPFRSAVMSMKRKKKGRKRARGVNMADVVTSVGEENPSSGHRVAFS